MPAPIVQPTAGEPHPHRPGDVYWAGTIVVSFTIAADGALQREQARINEGIPARLYRFGRAIQIIDNPLPAARQRAEEDAKRDALQMVSTLRYPNRDAECQGEFTVTFKLPSD
jgi:hypothetical protein